MAAFPIEDYLSGMFFGNTLLQYAFFFSFVIGAIVAGKIISYISKTILKALSKKTKSVIDDILIEIIEGPLILVVVIIGFYFGYMQLTLPPSTEEFFFQIVKNLITIALSWFTIRLVEKIIVHYVAPLAERTETDLDDHILPLLSKLSKYVLITITALIILSNFGINVTSALAGLGIGGLAVALAAQETLKNILGGVAILSDKPFKLNDWVEIDKYQGTVVEIGLRSTRLKTITGEFVTIPNSIIASTSTVNYLKFSSRKITFTIGLSYDMSVEKIEKAKKIIKKILEGNEHVLKNTVDVHFTRFGNYSLDLDVVFEVDTNKGLLMKTIKDSINLRILKEFFREKIDIAFPTQTINLKK